MQELYLFAIKILLFIFSLYLVTGSIYQEKSKHRKIYKNILFCISIIIICFCIYFIFDANTPLEILLTIIIFIGYFYIFINIIEKKD